MKRVIIFSILVLGLAACGGSEDLTSGSVVEVPDVETKATDDEVAETDDKPEKAALPTPPVVISSTDLGSGIYMLEGRGGNIGVLTGPDGAFVVDSQFGDIAEQTLAKIEDVSGGAPKYLINTHWHGDHSGGNVAYHEHGAEIVAHDNVLARLSSENESRRFGVTPASPEAAWPTITFSNEKEFSVNGQTVRLLHFPNAHTDGDTIVQFVEANMLHMGDIMFAGRFPFIDIDSGGSVDGYIAALDAAVGLCDEETVVMPGHGPISSREDIQALVDMLRDSKSRVEALIDEGKTLDQVIEAAPLNDYAQDWAWQFINEPIFTEILYTNLSR